MPLPYTKAQLLAHVVTSSEWARFTPAVRASLLKAGKRSQFVGRRVRTVLTSMPHAVAQWFLTSITRVMDEDREGGWMKRCIDSVSKHDGDRVRAGRICGAQAKRKFGIQGQREMSREGGRNSHKNRVPSLATLKEPTPPKGWRVETYYRYPASRPDAVEKIQAARRAMDKAAGKRPENSGTALGGKFLATDVSYYFRGRAAADTAAAKLRSLGRVVKIVG